MVAKFSGSSQTKYGEINYGDKLVEIRQGESTLLIELDLLNPYTDQFWVAKSLEQDGLFESVSFPLRPNLGSPDKIIPVYMIVKRECRDQYLFGFTTSLEFERIDSSLIRVDGAFLRTLFQDALVVEESNGNEQTQSFKLLPIFTGDLPESRLGFTITKDILILEDDAGDQCIVDFEEFPLISAVVTTVVCFIGGDRLPGSTRVVTADQAPNKRAEVTLEEGGFVTVLLEDRGLEDSLVFQGTLDTFLGLRRVLTMLWSLEEFDAGEMTASSLLGDEEDDDDEAVGEA